jgi:uncharacterized protein (TIGR03435 family)
VPERATKEQFELMLQGLLKERFGLSSHFQEKSIKGYRLTVAKGGAKLSATFFFSGDFHAQGGQHGAAQGGEKSHGHSGAMGSGSTADSSGERAVDGRSGEGDFGTTWRAGGGCDVRTDR